MWKWLVKLFKKPAKQTEPVYDWHEVFIQNKLYYVLRCETIWFVMKRTKKAKKAEKTFGLDCWDLWQDDVLVTTASFEHCKRVAERTYDRFVEG